MTSLLLWNEKMLLNEQEYINFDKVDKYPI